MDPRDSSLPRRTSAGGSVAADTFTARDAATPGPAPSIRPFGGLSRRDFLKLAAGAGFGAVAVNLGWHEGYAFAASSSLGGTSTLGSGTTPEQIHLVWGSDPSSEITVSWASPQAQGAPQVTLSPGVGGQTLFDATELTYTDGLSGEQVYAYHVQLTGLTPGATYDYVVADADEVPAVSFGSSFTMPGAGRFAFSFTSFGDLATPGTGATYSWASPTAENAYSTTYSESQWNAYNAVGEVETLAPLFHLLNGDLAYADKQTIGSAGGTTTNPASPTYPAPEVWRDFFLNMQRSAANRPWMPCIGNHEAELDNGPQGYASYNTRFLLPGNGTSFPGNFYSFQVGSVLFISLDANDVCYQGAGAYNVAGVATTDHAGNTVVATAAQYNQFYTGGFSQNPNGTFSTATPTSLGSSTPNAQTTWLEGVLASARADDTIDWIVVQMHQSALSSSTDNGCDAGIRQAWVPLFDQYQVDLVVNGHDHDYERSWPVRGFTAGLGTSTFKGGTVTTAGGLSTAPPTKTLPSTKGDPVNTFTPNVVTTDKTSPFDTTQGTVYMVLGGGGTDKQDNTYGVDVANVTTFTQVRTGSKPAADSTEPANWSAMTDTTDAYGVALFVVDPGTQGGNTTITVTYYHAPTQTSGSGDYSEYESFQLTRPRSDNPGTPVPELASPALAVGGTMALAGGALYLQQRRRAARLVAASSAAATPELSGN